MLKHLLRSTRPILCLALSGLFSGNLAANDLSFARPYTPYIGIDANYNKIETSEYSASPLSLKLRAGLFIQTNVALELIAGTNIKSDEYHYRRESELNAQQGVFLRFQSPIQQGLRVYLSGGYNKFTLLTTSSLPVSTFSEKDYQSVAWNVGIEEHFKALKSIIFYLDYSRPYDDEFRISQYSLGSRFQF
ncbi:MAG: porin family protein [Gammaproteobacteria bacterium]|nr:porin family protein [Gammaproteobacteria bacterium]